ncbi:MAG: hypothetical protein Q7T54_05860 [Candidatus Levybacteria bacterium]|nr:hypothetical protein [Candidatus Levybacteria bacterium]
MTGQNEQEQNFIDTLGFDPVTGMRIATPIAPRRDSFNIVERTLGFTLDTGERIPVDLESDEKTVEAFERKLSPGLDWSGAKYWFEGSLLFAAIDNNFKDVSRQYHYLNPHISLGQQKFLPEKVAVFEKKGEWGQHKPPKDYRLSRIVLTDFEKVQTQSVEFWKDNTVEITLKGNDWGNTSIFYRDGKLTYASTSNGNDYFVKKGYEDQKATTCELTGVMTRFYIPNYLDHPLPTEKFISDIRLEQNPFLAPVSADRSWAEADIVESFGIRLG